MPFNRSLTFPIALALLLSGAVPRQSFALDPNRTLTQYVHRIWGQDEGLIQPTIYSILQTSNGFLWLGTQDRLIRFDGIRFHEFSEFNDSQFEHSLIRSLFEDRDGNLWIASLGNGVARLAPDGSVTRFTTRQGLPNDEVFCIVSDAQDHIWFCTNGGLARWDARDGFRTFTTADGLPSNQTHSFCESKDGTQWVTAFDAPLSIGRNGHFQPFHAQSGPPLPRAISALQCAEDNSVWAGSDNGLFHIENGAVRQFTSRDGLLDDSVFALAAGPHGSIWIGTRSGINRYRPIDGSRGEFSTYSTRDGLSHSSVLALYVDREGTLWAGTKNGLDQFTDGNVTPYTTHEGMPGNDAGPVIEDSAGRLWVGTQDCGLSEFDGHRFHTLTTRNGLVSNRILSLEVDRRGDLWAGGEGGLNRLRDGRVISTFTRRNGLPGDVQSLFVDKTGQLWAGTDEGLRVFNGVRFERPNLPQASKVTDVLAIAGTQHVQLFVSADPGGLYVLKDGVFRPASITGVPHSVSSFYIDQVRHIAWFGTLGSGLLRWQNGALTHIHTKDGLYDNRIYSILKDDSGNFWLASSKGIFRVSEKDLEDFSAGRIRTVTSIPFTTGQLRFECQSDVQPAAWRTHDGRLWFSTTSGLVVVDPRHLGRTTIPPPVQITATFLNGQPKNLNGLDLHGPFQKNLEIRYAGLSFISPEKVTFRYMLEGYDKSWVEAGTRREAFFTNLPPGHFHFKVQARNADGIPSTRNAGLDFVIEPLIYQRSWFWVLVAGCLALLIAAGYRLRINRLQSRFDLVLAERGRIARELHDTLLQGLSGVTMQLQALWTRLPLSRDREALADIIEDAGRCSTEARQSLWGLRVMDASPLGFPASLAKIAREATGGTATSLVLDIDRVSHGQFGEIEFQLLRIAQEAITNVVRHAAADTLTVSLKATGQGFVLSIADDGDGFDVDRDLFGHFGLVGMRERAAEIGATLSVSSTRGVGSRVTVSLAAPTATAAKRNLPSAFVHLQK
ncbi:MAG TPA: two-component regulator propeller domain-containing protein [Bryobacteraceae bacterium]|nr:two-component regulator propeller domain-containing protein [Bryobacteraceae bacterium]